MKKLSLFAMAMAAMAFAACTQDDDLDGQANKQLKEGELVDAVSINFGEVKSTATRVYKGTEKGEGTEGRIYEAFVFAKEANPSHTRAKTGDYTVIRVTVGPDGNMLSEVGGVDDEATSKDKLTKAINENSTADVEWLVEKVATFRGVRQGDYVYVIANDPTLTLAQASQLAHQGEDSEANIRDYVAAINKDYLNGLVYRPEYNNELPSGRFFMAGREMIPTSPNIPANGVFALSIGLDRELAKINFSASVSTSTQDAACGNVTFKGDDGIVVARIARKTSPFVNQENGDWYIPAATNKEDWPINSHAMVNGVYSSYCDGTMDGARVFDGTSATPITNWVTGTTIAANFNATAPASDVTEYRYSWKINGTSEEQMKDPKNYVYVKSGSLYSPMFYTTPNYSGNTNSVTVICTQATYVGRGVFALSDMADKYVNAALANTGDSITLYTKEELAALEDGKQKINDYYKKDGKFIRGLNAPNPLTYTYDKGTTKWVESNITAQLKQVIDSIGVALIAEKDYPTTKPTSGVLNGLDYKAYSDMMSRFYLAVLIQQRLDSKNTPTTGTKATNATTKKDYGNGITEGVTAFLANAVTDSLMVGAEDLLLDGETVRGGRAFYIELDKAPAEVYSAFAKAYDSSTVAAKNEHGGDVARKYFFVNLDAYEYFKGQKVYYRADVADYTSDSSNKLTERNVYYNTAGLIKSLGAKSIHDAIYADDNTMTVTVTVKDWRLSVNQVSM